MCDGLVQYHTQAFRVLSVCVSLSLFLSLSPSVSLSISLSISFSQNQEEEPDFKEDQKFADLLQEKTEAVSEFAQEKTLQQQRQYLPIFAARNEVSGL